jgi:hypothetical protein
MAWSRRISRACAHTAAFCFPVYSETLGDVTGSAFQDGSVGTPMAGCP